MAIAVDNTGEGKQASGTSLTFSYTTSGSDIALLVGFFTATTDVATGVTFDGTALTQYSKGQNGSGRYQYVYGGIVTAKTGDIVVSISGGAEVIVACCASYTGVGSIAAGSTNSGTGTALSLTQTPIPDNSWTFMFARAGTSIAAGANTTERHQSSTDADTAIYDTNGAITPAASNTLNATGGTSSSWFTNGAILSPVASSLVSGLVSYWKFDESSGTADDAVTTNDLALTGSPSYTTGKINNGLLLASASNQYASKTTPVSVPGAQVSGDVISVNGWVKMTSQPGSAGVAGIDSFLTLWDGNTGDYRSWRTEYYKDAADATFLRFIVTPNANGSGATVMASSQTLSNGTWYMVTFTKSGTSMEIFVNGSSIGTATAGSATLASTGQNAKLMMGQFDNGSDSGVDLDGEVDEWGVWNKVLSGAEITSLYNSGAGFQYPFVASGPANLKSLDTNLKANSKSIDTNLIANVKSVDTNV